MLDEACAVRECEEQGRMQDRADPHALERAFDITRHDAPAGISPATPAGNARRNDGHRRDRFSARGVFLAAIFSAARTPGLLRFGPHTVALRAPQRPSRLP